MSTAVTDVLGDASTSFDLTGLATTSQLPDFSMSRGSYYIVVVASVDDKEFMLDAVYLQPPASAAQIANTCSRLMEVASGQAIEDNKRFPDETGFFNDHLATPSPSKCARKLENWPSVD